jgi:hypothetical protein
MSEKLQAIEMILAEDAEVRIPFKCFCCNDTGLVSSPFIHEFVEGINERTKPFICHACEKGQKFIKAYYADDNFRVQMFSELGKQYAEITTQKLYQAQFDIRLKEFICLKIHALTFEKWKAEEYERINIKKQYEQLIKHFEMQKHDKSPPEKFNPWEEKNKAEKITIPEDENEINL